MIKFIPILFLFFSLIGKSQTYYGATGAIQNNGQETYFGLSVSGLSQSQLDGNLGLVEICLDISHPAVQELEIFLQSPTGTLIELTEGSSCSGGNYTNTCFSNS